MNSVDDDDLAILDHVVLVPLENRVRLERLLHRVLGLVVRQVIEVVDVQRLLDLLLALLGQPRGAMLLFQDVIARVGLLAGLVALDGLAALQSRDDLVRRVVLVGRQLGGTGNDQGRPRLVHENRIDFVHDGESVPALHAIGVAELHVVAQVVEAELVVRPVSDRLPVSCPALDVVQAVNDHTHSEPEPAIDPAHPFGVALREVVVDRDHMDPGPGDSVQIDSQGSGQGLALAGLHLGNLAFVQHDAADQLHVEVAHAQHPPGRLAANGERFRQQVVQRLARSVPFDEFRGLGLQVLVGHGLHLAGPGVDLVDAGLEALEFALVLGTEYLG